MKSGLLIFLFLGCCNIVLAQTGCHIQGSLAQSANTIITLKGFSAQGDTLLSSSKTDANGRFSVNYTTSYQGAGILEIKDRKSVILLLNRENFAIQWDKLEDYASLEFSYSPENDSFGKGLELYRKTEGKRAGLTYLLPLYDKASKNRLFIENELKIQSKAMTEFLMGLPQDSYARYYLKLRQLIADMPLTAKRYIERLPEHENEFNNMDFANDKLIRSGLSKELFEGYFILLESYGEMQYLHMNASIDAVIKSLQSKPALQQQVAENLFLFLEKRSLFPAAEHLALAMLSDNSCQLDGKYEALFEQYRKMAKGNVVPELQFVNTKSKFIKLSEIESRYKLVVFGSSWCPKCIEDIPKIKSFYEQWKSEYGLEVILVSLDNEKEKYEAFTKDFPWISSCDLKGWEGKGARNYCVFGTPTLYLLDYNNKIVLKPISPEQVQAWLEMRKK
ncbi:MAG: thioredoxin family protein [Flavobacterium sp.]